MIESIAVMVDQHELIQHINRCCKRNMARNARICRTCPFRDVVKKMINGEDL